MAAPLKDQFGPDVVRRIAAALPVDTDAFTAECLDGFDDLELMARGTRVAAVMRAHLDPDPGRAVEQVAGGLGEQLGFGYLAHSAFIAAYGIDAYDESIAAQHALTQVFTAEFSIRPFIIRYPRTMDQLRAWTTDPSEHVRRLVSEGTRPRLPWATRLPAFQADPAPVIALLDLLKDDPSEYVQRSVGNNLNDISRDHPELALATAAAWAPGRGRLIRRGLRTLVKAGEPAALEILGYGPTEVTATATLPERLEIGQSLPLTVNLHGHDDVLVDLRVYFVKSDGSTAPKVFRGGEVRVAGTAQVRKTISFAMHSTRRQHPGPHRIEALVNGIAQPLGTVWITADGADVGPG